MDIKSKIPDQNLIYKLVGKVQSYERKICKMIAPYRRTIDFDFTKKEQKLDLRILAISSQILRILYSNFKPDSSNSWNLEKQGDYQCLRVYSKFKMPKFTEVKIFTYKKRQKILNSFMEESLPNEIQELKFIRSKGDIHNRNLEKIGKYFKGLRLVLPRVISNVSISRFDISKKQLQSIFYLSKGAKGLTFNWCKLDLITVPNLGKSAKQCRIEQLIIYGCGLEFLCNWNENSSHFSNLVCGLSQTEWAHSSLKKIFLNNNNLHQQEIVDTLKEYQLNHLKFN
ncbi:unnamed protein product [Moneuplotes crassus]|uniref:Uncharacterized protein n=1 Tax=Euplotes crassus TaxID=5936 RepID=A0AAD2D0Q4_EUPCR|nr:unnamed protein product [Moneuplotes crassus]